MITFGINFGGPEQKGSLMGTALLKAANTAGRVREPNYHDGREAWINPIFMAPGSIWKPDFEGYKVGYFSRKRKGLVVMIVVPQSVVEGERVSEFVVSSLREAVRIASAHFSQKSISFSTLKAEKIIMAIEASLRQF